VVQLAPGGVDAAEDPARARCGAGVHGVFLSSLYLAKVIGTC
jgi:hypothetical protein